MRRSPPFLVSRRPIVGAAMIGLLLAGASDNAESIFDDLLVLTLADAHTPGIGGVRAERTKKQGEEPKKLLK